MPTIRLLQRSRGFAAIAILILGCGLMLCITAFAVANAYLLRTLPYPAADRLYTVEYAAPGQRPPRDMERLDWRTLDDIVEHPLAWDLDMFYVLGGRYPESAPGAWVTPGYMQGFGIRPAIGRAFEASDFEAGRPQVALISHRMWRTRFAGDPAIVGRGFSAYVSDRPEEAETFTVIGVLPADLWHTNPYTEVLAPLRAPTYPYLVRLREGATPEIAAQRITALVRAGDATLPADWRVVMRSAHASYVAQVRPLVVALGVAAGLVLLIACANVAVLMLVRASRRQREIAVRLALGATRGAIARLLIAEGLAIGGAATIVGLGLSWMAVGGLGPMIERQLGRQPPGGAAALAVDWTVVIAAVVCGLLTVCGVMLAPLASCWRTRGSFALVGGRGATEGPASRRMRSVLIAFEVAASLALLSGSVLMVSSAVRMLGVDFGMQTGRVLIAGVGLRARAYPDALRRSTFFSQVPARLAGVAGVESVALSDWWPLQPPPKRRIEIDGASSRTNGGASDSARDTVTGSATDGARGRARAEAGVMGVSAGYFATLGIPRRAGRVFADRDALKSEAVAIVSETMARQLWPRSPAVGQRLLIMPDAQDRDANGAAAVPVWHAVVGVVGDVRQTHADLDRADVYIPLLQRAARFAFVHIRLAHTSALLQSVPAPSGASGSRDTNESPASRDARDSEQRLREALATLDPEVSMGTPRLLDHVLDQERTRPRFLASLLVAFAVFAGLLALVGMYGAIAYAVRQREREIAVRMAIGANRQAVTRLFVRQGALVLCGGLTLGAAAAIASGRLLESQLYGVRPGDPWLLVLTTTGFAICGLLAVWIPARRAAAMDPAAALKQEL
jgi:putative ABC transport system permease protein